jgi:hypothetical protein
MIELPNQDSRAKGGFFAVDRRTWAKDPSPRHGPRGTPHRGVAGVASNVDSMIVLRARRGGTASIYVTLRGGRRRGIPFLLVRLGRGARDPLLYAEKRSGLPARLLPAETR